MKLKLLIAYCTLFIFVAPTLATSSTPSAKAKDLMDRVATKVAELSLKFQKSYRGTIKSLGTTSILITTDDGSRSINTSDATSFYRIRANKTTEINFTSLKKDDNIAALGTIDPATSDLTARQIIAKIRRTNLVGIITGIDKNFLTVGQTKIDLADATLKKVASESGKIVAAKESDFKTGSKIFAITHSPDEKTGVFSVLKALLLLQ